MSDRKWHSGPPPHVGWWNASHFMNNEIWRWWNGTRWSRFITSNTAPVTAGDIANLTPECTVDDIYWSDYWPKNARVPRIDPRIMT